MPRVPAKQKITVSGYEEHEMQNLGDQQIIRVDVNEGIISNNIRNWKLVLEYNEVYQSNEGDITFQKKRKTIYTTSNVPKITVRDLSAGQRYSIAVSGVNDVGVGPLSEARSVTVGHRLVNAVFYDGYNMKFNDEFPSWYQSIDFNLVLSMDSHSAIAKVTLHRSKSSTNSVDHMEYNDDELYNECGITYSTRDKINNIECLIEDIKVLERDEEMEVRVWDSSNLLVAKGNVAVLSPNPKNCKRLGRKFCSLRDTSDCVSDCISDCSTESFDYSNNCTVFCQLPMWSSTKRPLSYTNFNGKRDYDCTVVVSFLSKTKSL